MPVRRPVSTTHPCQRSGSAYRGYDIGAAKFVGADIAGKGAAPRAAGTAKPAGKVAVKYRNAATGDSWTGRGLQPKWLKAALAAGGKLEDFTV